jgi:short-subunit dehydrogenase
MNLDGCGVILTGASGGIGSALAGELLAAGAELLAVGRSASNLQPLAALATGTARGRIQLLAADITGSADRQRIVAQARTLTRPALLVHAAAAGHFGLFADGSDALAERLMQTNALAPMALTRALLPLLARQPEAAVVAIGSTFGSLAFPGFAEYSASKFALRGLMEALAREYADQALRFQWLAPRATDTGFNPPAVQSLNRELGTRVDSAQSAARQILAAIRSGSRRRQLGWPERLLARLNGALPELVDAGLRKSLASIRSHARQNTAPTHHLLQEDRP